MPFSNSWDQPRCADGRLPQIINCIVPENPLTTHPRGGGQSGLFT